MLEVGIHSLKCAGFKDVRLSSSMHDPNGDGEEMERRCWEEMMAFLI